MEGRMKKYRQVSPDRAKVRMEPSPKCQGTKVPVVYYLCRNRHLEHPHFIEVPLSSPDGLYLKDVTNRLNALRGKGMPSMYSWSCKRSYKSGFVWHDLCENDLILPAHGSEYVLKGSELFEESHSDHVVPNNNCKSMNLKQLQLPEPMSSRSHGSSSSFSSVTHKEMRTTQENETSPPLRCPTSSDTSPESRVEKNLPVSASLSLAEFKVQKGDREADASTQTEENVRKRFKDACGTSTLDIGTNNGLLKSEHKDYPVRRDNDARETCTRGVSTDDGSLQPEHHNNQKKQAEEVKENSDLCRDDISPPPSSSSTSSSGGKTETLESLIRADAHKMNSFRILREEELCVIPHTKLKASNMLMQLISCGSIAVKDHSLGFIPTYRSKISHSKFSSPLYSSSMMLGELDCLSENPKFMGTKLEDKEYFSGSMIEVKTHREGEGFPSLKRSSSYNADRTCKSLDLADEKEKENNARSKCIPRSIKVSLSKPHRSEISRSLTSEAARSSSAGLDSSLSSSLSVSNASSKRISEPFPVRKPLKNLEKEKVTKYEERLASGARVIIQSKAPCDDSDESI